MAASILKVVFMLKLHWFDFVEYLLYKFIAQKLNRKSTTNETRGV